MANINPPNDSKAGAFQDGDVMTVEALIRNFAPAVMGICLANTNSIHDAEDVMQEVFLKILRYFPVLKMISCSPMQKTSNIWTFPPYSL